MKKIILLISIWTFNTAAEEFDATAMNKVEGCMNGPVNEFGQYIGDWNILERRLGQDGEWTATNSPAMARINAVKQDNGSIIMHYVTEISPKRRITFFPPHETGWNWQMEMDFDGRGWTKVLELIASK
ncbi:MAG: hypothetical protein HOI58_01955 [Kordiimonadaceae bacterium]|nr:hypothetical protein [Kordiimonadaceae bacterium]